MRVIDATIRLIDRFTPTLKNINKQIEQQQRANERMAKSVQATGKAMQGLGEKLLPVSAAAVAFGGYGVKAFGDFEEAMNKVKVKLDESDWGRFDELKEQAKTLSTQYAYSAAEIAEAQENIVAAGWNVNAVLSATPTVMNLAAAAGVDMATASSILTDNMTAFGIEAEKANGFADMLAVTANATNTSIPAMAESYKYCASAARAMGVDLADTSTLIGMLANSGIKGSEAGTSVKDMLERLAIPAHRANLEALGVVVKDASGNFVGMRSVLDQTRNAMQGMDQLQKMEIIKEAFGSTALPGVMALLNQTTGDYDKLNESIRNSTGTCQQAADVMNGGFNAELKKTANAVNLAAMNIGEKLVPYLKAAGNEIVYMANCIKGMSPAQVDLTIKVAGFVVGLTAALLIGGKMMVLYGSLGRTMIAFSSAIVKAGGLLPLLSSQLGNLAAMFRVVGMAARLLFMNPVGIAIMAIIAIAYLLYTHWDTICNYLQSKFGGLGEKFGVVAQKFIAIWNKLAATASAKGTVLHAVINHIMVAWQNFCNIFSAVFDTILNIIVIIFDTIASLLAASINGWIGILDGFATFFNGLISGDIGMACEGLKHIFSSAFGAIKEECDIVMQGIKSAINAVIGGINSVSVTVPDWVPGIGGQQYQPSIPMLAKGTDNWQGGTAMIHDAGAEIVDLPAGSRVIPHDKSLQNEYARGKADGANKSTGVNIIIQNMNVREESDIDKIANAIAQKLENHAMNSAVCAV